MLTSLDHTLSRAKMALKTEIDFVCVTKIDPSTSWFQIVELPVTEFNSAIPMGSKGSKVLAHINP